MSWRTAHSLDVLLDQVNAAFPGRDKSSDGTIGDASHQATKSEHNPDANGIVRARDITHDPAHGLDARKLAEALVASRDPRILYVISNAQICSSVVSPWVWRPYNGVNAHRAHMHLSVVESPALYDDTRQWSIDGVHAMPSGPALQLSNGRGSWYSQFSGKFKWVDTGDAPGSAALGCPDDAQGISFYDHSTLGHWFEVTAPNGVTSIEQQTDIGPNPRTGRTIDISAAAAERFGYSPRNFPTDSTFSWRPIAAPASVASLTPVQQAVRFRDLRKDQPVIDQPSNLPATPAPATDDGTVKIDLRYILQMITRILDMIDEIKKAKATPAPVVTPGTTTTKSKPDIVVGVLGTIAAALGWGTSTIGAPVGDHATLASIVSFAAPIAMTLLGSNGVSIIPSILGLLGRFKA